MKLPKKLIIAGKEFKVIGVKGESGACAFLGPYVIKIGTKCEVDIPELLLHEIFEATLDMRGYRFSSGNGEPEDSHRFVFTHKQLTQVVIDIANTIKGLKF